MVDIHMHILHALDDGAMDLEEALAMLTTAEEGGITDIIATPHSWAVDNIVSIDKAIIELNNAAIEEGTKTRVYGGCEFNVADGKAITFLGDDLRKLTLAGSKYLLTEFSNSVRQEIMFDSIERITVMGLVPIIAHPERYAIMWGDLSPMRKMVSMGALGQISMGDLIGRNGLLSMQTAYKMIDEGLCQICASDAHTPEKLKLYLQALDAVKQRYGKTAVNKLFTQNPASVLANLDESHIEPV
jgi:protein-tyrosine phosphatase